MVHTPRTLAVPSDPDGEAPHEGDAARGRPPPSPGRGQAAVGMRAGSMAMGRTEMVEGTPFCRMGGGMGTPPALDGMGGGRGGRGAGSVGGGGLGLGAALTRLTDLRLILSRWALTLPLLLLLLLLLPLAAPPSVKE